MKYKLFSLRELLLSSSKNQIKKILKTFKCEKNKDLESFLHNKAILFEEKGRSRTYIYINIIEKEVVAYFTISISSLYIENFSKETISYIYGEQKIKFKCLPCYLIGQLGKSDKCKIKVGKFLLKRAIKIILDGYNIFNGRFILLDAINNEKIIKFYEDNGFMAIENLSNDKEVIKMIYWLID